MGQIKLIPPPSERRLADVYNAARAAFISRGLSLNAWCRANGTPRQTAEQALRGSRNGDAARKVRKAILDEIGLKEGGL